jgi:tRNA pseudouridine13 synthase
MKLKCRPDDFCVTEKISRQPTEGTWALYRLTKTSVGTLDAVRRICANWNLSQSQCRHAGLKDRHATTCQFLTIARGPSAGMELPGIQLEYVGQTDRPLTADDIVANSFEIVLRSLTGQEEQHISDRLPAARQTGYPNYFDEQRFGSLGPSQEYVAQAWCQKNYERALWLTFAEHNVHDDAAERNQKQLTRDLWGQWGELKAQLDRSHRRSVVTYLVDHPSGFRKAFALVNPDLRGLFLSAFQSAVWNRMLGYDLDPQESDRSLRIADALLPFTAGAVPVHDQIALPSVRAKGLSAELKQLYARALRPYGMKPQEMKISFPRDRWFSRARRDTMIIPQKFSAETADDDLSSGHRKIVLKFDLPRGCYATMLVRFLSESRPGD